MRRAPSIVFVFNLLQDVNVLRGLVHLAARETSASLVLLETTGFIKRDGREVWRAELAKLAREAGAERFVYGQPAQALAALWGRRGLIIAGSESDLSNHRQVHELFRVAPPGWCRVTLQHGLECVGFLQNREHVVAHGLDVRFGADVVVSWSGSPRMLTAMGPGEAAKLYVGGPSALLQRAVMGEAHPPIDGGMVCENMHSVRLRATGDHVASFMDVFEAFCAEEERAGNRVTLRPHPGGQYVLRNDVPLPDNVTLNNLPIYEVALERYAYGISAPSTVVLDMVLAGIPTAVWRDPGGVMDARNYDGLTPIDRLETWTAFAAEARERPHAILERQRRYLDRLGILTDTGDIYARYARLLVNGLERAA